MQTGKDERKRDGLTETQRHSLRTIDIRLLERLQDGDLSRLTMTERWRIQQLRDEISSQIHKHYYMTELDRMLMRRYEDNPNEIPIEKDAVEKVLEKIYQICKYYERGWYGYRKIESGDMTNTDWVLEFTTGLASIAQSVRPTSGTFVENAQRLAALAVLAASKAFK